MSGQCTKPRLGLGAASHPRVRGAGDVEGQATHVRRAAESLRRPRVRLGADAVHPGLGDVARACGETGGGDQPLSQRKRDARVLPADDAVLDELDRVGERRRSMERHLCSVGLSGPGERGDSEGEEQKRGRISEDFHSLPPS